MAAISPHLTLDYCRLVTSLTNFPNLPEAKETDRLERGMERIVEWEQSCDHQSFDHVPQKKVYNFIKISSQ